MTKEETYRLEDLQFTNYENLNELYSGFIYSVLANTTIDEHEKHKIVKELTIAKKNVTFENMKTIKDIDVLNQIFRQHRDYLIDKNIIVAKKTVYKVE